MRTFSNLMNKRRPRIRRQNIYGSPFPRASDHDSWWRSEKRKTTPPRKRPSPVQQRRSLPWRNNRIRNITPPERRSRDYTRAQMLQMGNSAQGPSRRVHPSEAIPRQGNPIQGSPMQGSSQLSPPRKQSSPVQQRRSPARSNNEFRHFKPPAFDEERLKERRIKHYNQIMGHKKRDEPLSWKLAKECFRDQLLHGYRSRKNISEYNNEKRRNDETWRSIEDVIKNEVFGMPSFKDPYTEFWYVPGDVGVNERRLIVNRFPYHYEPEVTNFVLWYGNADATKEEKMRMVLECEELNEYDLIVYENPPEQKSVLGIAHLQILARKTPEHNTRTIYF